MDPVGFACLLPFLAALSAPAMLLATERTASPAADPAMEATSSAALDFLAQQQAEIAQQQADIQSQIDDVEKQRAEIAREKCEHVVKLAELACNGHFCVPDGESYIYLTNNERWWYRPDGTVVGVFALPEEATCLEAWHAR
jgi:hypothetical protein